MTPDGLLAERFVYGQRLDKSLPRTQNLPGSNVRPILNVD